MLAAGSSKVQEHAAGALKELASDFAGRAAVVAAGAIPALVALLAAGRPPSVQALAAAALGHLALEPAFGVAASVAIPHLGALLEGTAAGAAAAAALTNLGNIPDRRVAAALTAAGATAFPRLAAMAARGSPAGMQEVAAATLGTLAMNNANQGALVAAGMIPRLVGLLAPGNPAAVQVRAAAGLCNLVCNDGTHRKIVATMVAARGAPALIEAVMFAGGEATLQMAAAARRNVAFNSELAASAPESYRPPLDARAAAGGVSGSGSMPASLQQDDQHTSTRPTKRAKAEAEATRLLSERERKVTEREKRVAEREQHVAKHRCAQEEFNAAATLVAMRMSRDK
jgi:hypothetical protein